MPKPPQNRREFKSLCDIVETLRGPEGCPWDKEQTHESLVKFAIEETYELAEAIEARKKLGSSSRAQDEEIKAELGDVLLQVVLHSEIARQEGRFDIGDVIENLNEKMIRRHPHVFSDVKVSDSGDVIANWQKIKEKEKAQSGRKRTPSEALQTPKGLPALMEADKIGGKTKKFGFDWTDVKDVLTKVKEEVSELEEALERWSESGSSSGSGSGSGDDDGSFASRKVPGLSEVISHPQKEELKEAISREIGDALFSLAQLARHLGFDPEQSLRTTNQRFRRRFRNMLDAVGGDLDVFTKLSGDEKEELWTQAKRTESE